MAYDLDQFIADCRSTLERDPGPAGREQVRANLERLLANADFVSEHCGEDVPRGLKVLSVASSGHSGFATRYVSRSRFSSITAVWSW